MVGGQPNNIGCIIQARFNSDRLPGKVMMELPLGSGIPLLGRIVQALLNGMNRSQIVVASSVEPSNEHIEKFCKEHSIDYYRGDEKNVLSRFLVIQKQKQFDHVVRLTGDNPFLDMEVLQLVMDSHLKAGADYTYSSGLPIGTNFEIVKGETLLSLSEKTDLTEPEKEHVTLYFRQHKGYLVNQVKINLFQTISDLRLTVDYPSDFILASTIFSLLPKSVASLSEITGLVKQLPWLAEVNASNFQKKQFDSIQDELTYAIELLTRLEMHHAAGLLKQSNEESRVSG